MRVAMAQISSTDDPSENLATLRAATQEAASRGARLVVFPEATMCRFGVPLKPVAEEIDGSWARGVSEVAASAGVTVVAGMFTPSDDGRVFNTVLVAHPDGSRLGYDKLHLYDAFGFHESKTVAPGAEPVTFEVDGVTVGVATCYDIRFPALFTTLARRGAQVIVVPTSWGAGPGKIHQWEVLATARALDSTTFVVAVGQALPPDEAVAGSGVPTGIGHSQITDPFGTVVAAYPETVCVDVHDLDLELVEKARMQLAVLANERALPVGDAVHSELTPAGERLRESDDRGRNP
ncbi:MULTISPECIES: carbon-nitrogen hydrolase family protein [Gordonia]|uniref:carbon-nitrogen hydrolase family protein n=1 Tax=Gordonia TaxID=2053 RepID=UPI0002A631A0|nr:MULTISPECIES: carbon-nitrogen hydrolase family protein [Gordonia]ATD69448.1 hydrolase [Gordonia sp. 1D]MCZ4579953.1 carbon-nitrogen hydrolase family protein [Gordonia amicalis]MDJ0451817.1 carbon-nitrogen hydrolase family protein [Gordonia amicalis]MDV7076079.1 carbon-nitrogen hydrolase family protein [Gordonia amicalis]NKX78789.1 carbon-nitrogen hydrolase family protein [Gordonia amicalis]